MDNLSASDWFVIAFFGLSGFWAAFQIGAWLTRLLLLGMFCRDSKLQDLAWKAFTVAEMRYGELKGKQTYTLHGKEYSVQIMRRQPEPVTPAPEEPEPAAAP